MAFLNLIPCNSDGIPGQLVDLLLYSFYRVAELDGLSGFFVHPVAMLILAPALAVATKRLDEVRGVGL
jgi:hypothetical protein